MYAGPTKPEAEHEAKPEAEHEAEPTTTGQTEPKARAVGLLGTGLIDPSIPALHPDDLGLTRGDGCFEATRVRTDPAGVHRVDHLPEHLDRFDVSCAGLDLPPIDRVAWCDLIDEVLASWRYQGEAILKLMLSRGRESRPGGPITGLVTLTSMSPETLRQRREGVDAITLCRGYSSQSFADARWLLGGIKTLSYAVNVAATREALRRGAQDVVFTSADGYLLEAPTATLVWLTGGLLHTTSWDGTGVLASITQQALFRAAEQDGLHTEHCLGTIADLQAADGAWLVSSGRGIAQLRSLDGQPLPVEPAATARLSALAGF
jgi:4-amino-4-deoxychorismate lyase